MKTIYRNVFLSNRCHLLLASPTVRINARWREREALSRVYVKKTSIFVESESESKREKEQIIFAVNARIARCKIIVARSDDRSVAPDANARREAEDRGKSRTNNSSTRGSRNTSSSRSGTPMPERRRRTRVRSQYARFIHGQGRSNEAEQIADDARPSAVEEARYRERYTIK